MSSFNETKDTLTIITNSVEVGAGSFIQLYIRTKNRTTTKLINNGTEYFVKHNEISPRLDGSVTLIKDTKETEVFIERFIYTASLNIDNDEFQVVGKIDPLTGGMGFNGNIVDMDETPDETNTEDYPVGTLFISPAE